MVKLTPRPDLRTIQVLGPRSSALGWASPFAWRDVRGAEGKPRPEARGPRTSTGQAGFTLIELLVVVTIIGLLAGAAVVNVRNARRKANEAVLKKDLHDMREAIDNFYADKQRYPTDLNELVPHYLRAIPKDPVTNTPDWEPVMEQVDPDAPPNTDTSGAPAAPGVVDVKTKAPGTTLDGVAYTDL